jgi:hypothetical protein
MECIYKVALERGRVLFVSDKKVLRRRPIRSGFGYPRNFVFLSFCSLSLSEDGDDERTELGQESRAKRERKRESVGEKGKEIDSLEFPSHP